MSACILLSAKSTFSGAPLLGRKHWNSGDVELSVGAGPWHDDNHEVVQYPLFCQLQCCKVMNHFHALQDFSLTKIECNC